MSRMFNNALILNGGKCGDPDNEYRFFCLIPEIGICYFKTLASAEAFGKAIFDHEQADETDMEDYASRSICGEIKSVSGMTTFIERPESIPMDQEGEDSEGNYWQPEWGAIVSWGFLPLQSEPVTA